MTREGDEGEKRAPAVPLKVFNGEDGSPIHEKYITDRHVAMDEISLHTTADSRSRGEEAEDASLLARAQAGSRHEPDDLEAPFPAHSAKEVSFPRRVLAFLLKRPCVLIVGGIIGLLFIPFGIGMAYKDQEVILPCQPTLLPVPKLSKMSLNAKIGQMVMADAADIGDGHDIVPYELGGVSAQLGWRPKRGADARAWLEMAGTFQARSMKTKLRIPILFAADAIHGMALLPGTTVFPHHVGLACSRNAELVQLVGLAAAQEMAAVGVRLAFGPSNSGCRDPRWGLCYEAAGEHSNLAELLNSYVDGCMGQATGSARERMEDGKNRFLVACTAKGWLNEGGTQNGITGGNAVMNETNFIHQDTPAFLNAIQRGVLAIMVSNTSFNGYPMHAYEKFLWEKLKIKWGFDGVLVSSFRGIQKNPGSWIQQVELAVNAGIDLVQVGPGRYMDFIAALTDLVRTKRVPMSRIDDAVSRIIQLKIQLGLFESPCGMLESLADGTKLEDIGSAEHRELARRAVRESLVLLKNGGEKPPLLPLALNSSDGSTKTILVAGAHAENIGYQCGGHTLSLQGGSGEITQGTTILQGIIDTVGTRAKVTYVAQPVGKEEADYGIVVVGERPYAGKPGDRASEPNALRLAAADQDTILEVCLKMPCVVVLVTGRPLAIDNLLPNINTLVVAWLPGTEGAGVADVVLGEYDFVGTLSRTWFRSVTQLPLTCDSPNGYSDGLNGPLFAHGFGLMKNGTRMPNKGACQ